MAYRRAPVLASGESPSQLMLNRNIRTRIDMLSGATVKKEPDIGSGLTGTAVWFKTFRNARNWEQGTIVRQVGDVMVDVQDLNGQVHRRHRSQIRTDHTIGSQSQRPSGIKDSEWTVTAPVPASMRGTPTSAHADTPQPVEESNQPTNSEVLVEVAPQTPPQIPNVNVPSETVVSVRRSTREQIAPQRLNL